jgi:hypothetical protein
LIRSWAELEAFLANGGRMVFSPGENPGAPTSWRDAESGQDIVSALATRALAEGGLTASAGQDGETIYARGAA